MARGSFKKSTLWTMGLSVYSIILSLIIGPLTARALGPENQGNLGYANALITLFIVFAQFGMRNIIIEELVQHPEREEETIGTSFVLRLGSTLLSIVLVCVAVMILKPNNQVIRYATYIQTTALFCLVFEVLMYWFQSKLYVQYYAIISAIGLTIEDIWKLHLIFKDPDIYKFAFANTIRYGFVLIALFILFYRMNPGFKMRFNKDLASRYVRRGSHYLLATLGTEVYYKIDTFMVGDMLSSANLAFYIVALNISDMWQQIPIAIINNVQAVLARLKKSDEDLYIKTYQTSLLGIFLFCTIACLFAMVLGGPVISFLYGAQYYQSIAVFFVIIWASVFSSLTMTRNNWIVCEKLDRYSKYFVLFGAIMDIVLNYIFIKQYGVVGAALSTLVTEFCVFFIAPYMFKETRNSNYLFVTSFRQLPFLLQYVKGTVRSIVSKVRNR